MFSRKLLVPNGVCRPWLARARNTGAIVDVLVCRIMIRDLARHLFAVFLYRL